MKGLEMRGHAWLRILTFSICCFALVGCGPPQYCRTNGTVTYQGKPIGWLQVRFRPVLADSVRDSIAMTDDDGRFEMTTGRKRGVKPGEYYVYLEDPLAVEDEMTRSYPEYLEIVSKYCPLNSPLRVKVERHDDNFNLVLE
jgi:hypothetical protein